MNGPPPRTSALRRDKLYVGLDSSTQSLTAIVIEVDGTEARVVFDESLPFDDTFPQYGTEHGVLSASAKAPAGQALEAFSSPVMWADALDTMMRRIADSGLDVGKIAAISGSAQQHGSVYLNASAAAVLGHFDASRPLAVQVAPMLSRQVAPIWMDSSTGAQCVEIAEAVGGQQTLARHTGSRAFERFTGPQIRKFAQTDPAAYAATDRIHLVSSFMASLLAGTHAPIDPGDGSGMNLMDLATKNWSPDALRATAPDLGSKLPPVAESWSIVGTLSPFWQRRLGFPAARVVAWSGDNPCSLVGTGLVREGVVAISLGTSDTIFGIMPTPRPSDDGAGHVFASPTGAYMGMTVFKNGSLARERVRDDYGLDWRGFSAALAATPAGNNGATMLPWFDPEITPLVLEPGVRRHGLDAADANANVRAVVEAQMMSLALHSRWMGVTISTIYATGGASANRDVLQVMSDVFNAEVSQLETGNSAALGAALRAFHADRRASGTPLPWEDVIAGFVVPRRDTRLTPQPANVEIYRELMELYAQREREALA